MIRPPYIREPSISDHRPVRWVSCGQPVYHHRRPRDPWGSTREEPPSLSLEGHLLLISAQQNNIIKIFSVVVLMPPTLVASIYGMNFKGVRELDWPFGVSYCTHSHVGSCSAPLPILQMEKVALEMATWFGQSQR